MRLGRLVPAALLAVVLTWMVLVPGSTAQEEAPAAPSVPELADAIPGAAWLLLPLIVILAVVTAVSLASGDEAAAVLRRDGGVSRALAARQARDRPEPPSS